MRNIFLILLLIVSFSAEAAPNPPLYVVDGRVGVSPDSLPAPEEVAQTTIIMPEKAVELYGERAFEGAFVVSTKKYMREQQQAQGYKDKSTGSRSSRAKNGRLMGLLFLLMAAIFFYHKQIINVIANVINLLRKNNIAKQTESHVHYDPEGVKISASRRVLNYLFLGVILFPFAVIILLIVKIATGKDPDNPTSVLMIVICVVFSIFTLLQFLTHCYVLIKCHLIIDENGLRGCYLESNRWVFMPTFKDVDISWEQVDKARRFGDCIFFYYGELSIPEDIEDFADLDPIDLGEPVQEIELSFLPSTKVVDCINYFYARHKNVQLSRRKLLVPPLNLNENPYVLWGFAVLAAVLYFVIRIYFL